MAQAPIKHTKESIPDIPSQNRPKMPAVDEYYKAVSGKFKIAKYLSVIVLVVFLVFSFTFLRKDITLENLRYLLKFISFTNTETSISAAKINYASGDPNRLDLFIGDLCTLSPEGYALYDSRGNQIMSEDLAYSSPVLKTGSRFTLCYDMNGSQYAVFNTYSKLHEGTTEYPITDAAIADDGSYVIASSTREYRTAITIYNEDFTAVSNIYENDYLMAMEMSDDGKLLALMTANVSEGGFVTTVELIVPGERSAKRTCSLEGLGYSFYFTENGYAAVTDEGVCFLDENLEPIRVHQHPSQLAMTHSTGKYIVCMYSEGIIGSSHSSIIYDVSGTKVYEGVFSGKLVGIDSTDGGDYVFILTGTTLTRINLINKRITETEIAKDAIDVLASSPDTVLAAFKNYALTYDLAGLEERYYERPDHETESVNTDTSSSDTANETVPVQASADPQIPAETVSPDETEAPADNLSEPGAADTEAAADSTDTASDTAAVQ